MSRKLTSVRLDNFVLDWFTLSGANLNGTVNRILKIVVQRCLTDEDFARKVIKIGKRYNYKIS